jgi:hypothetical protein
MGRFPWKKAYRIALARAFRRRQIAFAIMGALAFLAGDPAEATGESAPDHARRPVLLLHGRDTTPESFEKLIGYLVANGYPTEFFSTPTLPFAAKGTKRIADRVIAPAVDRLLAEANRAARAAGRKEVNHEKVDIVAHGLGTLAGRWYAAKVRPERIHLWISLSGANHGSNALCRSFDHGAHDSCPAFGRSPRLSPIQTGLNGSNDAPADETSYGFGVDAEGVPSIRPTPERAIGYFTFRLPFDDRITPAHSALLDGAGGLRLVGPLPSPLRETSPGNFLYDLNVADIRGAPEIDHESMLDHPDVHRFVLVVLGARWLWER